MQGSTMRRRDAAALVIATVTALAGLTTWLLGDVDMGVRLGSNEDGFLQIVEVAPNSLAEYYGFAPGAMVVELQRRDGSMAPQRTSDLPNRGDFDQPGDYLLFAAGEPPAEPEIDYISAVALDDEQMPGFISWGATLQRAQVTSRLEYGGVLLLIGIGLGLAAAAAVSRGWAGDGRKADATVAGVAIATPLMALPLIYAGSPVTGAAGFALPALGCLPLAWSLADCQPEASWASILRWTTIGLAGVAILLAGRMVLLGTGGHEQLVALAASVVAIPTVAGALVSERQTTERLGILAIGAVPVAAVLVPVSFFPELGPIILSVAAVVVWQVVPRIAPQRNRPARAGPPDDPIVEEEPLFEHDTAATRARRDVLSLLVAATTFVSGLLTCCETGAVIFGALFGALVAFALHRGLMGPGWSRAAVPLGCAIAIPLMALAFNEGGASNFLARLLLPAAGALPVAHLLAWRHPDPRWRRTLFGISVVLAAVVVLLVTGSSVGGPLDGPYELGDSGTRLTIYLAMGFIALAPGLGAALAANPAGSTVPTGRLDLLAIGLTPGAAMTVLPGYSPALWLLGAWLLALVAWRRFTIAPLLGMALRTQRQRDLAVVAVEAERARLAADLHDDALQEISALVRRLDAAGDAENADMARAVAERLRTITSDLRLPLLDDLGAGPALEWLVGRVRPLADGDVVLERTDPARPPANVELAVFRVAQEAITNAVKHGGTPITVRYRVAEDGGVSLTIDDSGPGIEPDAAERALRAGHLGMANMQQRAQQIGALLDVRRWPTGGTHVRLEWRPR
jgi:signal transduction histidine kinase